MPSYLHPGVYVEEIPSGSKPIEGVGTSVAAFVGEIARGDVGEAVLIHKWSDYEDVFGAITSESDSMGLAVSSFYLNGGKDAYICRLASTSSPATEADIVAGNEDGSTNVLNIKATSPGDWANNVYIRIVKPNNGDLDFSLEIGYQIDSEFVVEESFSGLNMNKESGDYILTQVNGNSQLVEVTDTVTLYKAGSLTGEAMGTSATVFSDTTDGIQDGMTMQIRINGGDAQTITIDTATVTSMTGDNNVDGGALANFIQLNLLPVTTTCQYDMSDVSNPKFVISSLPSSHSSVVVVDGSNTDLASFLKLDSSANTVSVHGTEDAIPKQILGNVNAGEPLTGGAYSPAGSGDYKNFFDQKLRKVRDVSIIVLPGKTWGQTSSDPYVSEAISHCEAIKSRMVIIDPPKDYVLDQQLTVNNMNLTTSTYGVLYYPWIKISNPFYHSEKSPNVSKTLSIAPSALAAGMWGKIDGKRGVWKAPAGLETSMLGVVDLDDIVEDSEQNQLNPVGVNCLRKIPGAGPVIWGSRTLATKSTPEWRYVPVRRTAIMIEQSIYNGIQWAVFEPNKHTLWSSLRVNIGSFMNGLFRAGAFQGEKASDAYFVRCGLGDTMTQGDIDRGQVIVQVGFAPVKPAEFVIVRIQQKVSQE